MVVYTVSRVKKKVIFNVKVAESVTILLLLVEIIDSYYNTNAEVHSLSIFIKKCCFEQSDKFGL